MSDCACDPCDGTPGLPDLVWNRPGLSAVGYRLGTFTTFRHALRQRLRRQVVNVSGQPTRPLGEWTLDDPADFGVALLDLWCYLADVITFYQERTANEAFLRTAVFPDSVRRLTALLGYRPAPGSAAAAPLAFTLEPGKRLTLPAGLRVQSVPTQDEKPQKFETGALLAADAKLNRVRVRPVPTSVPVFEVGNTSAPLGPDPPAGLAVGQALVLVGAGWVEQKQVTRLEADDGRTVLHWSPAVEQPNGSALYRWVRKCGLFGGTLPAERPEYRQIAGAPAGRVAWQVTPTPASTFVVDAAVAAAELDGPNDAFRPGLQVLVVDGTTVLVRTISTAELAVATILPPPTIPPAPTPPAPILTARVTRIHFTPALGVAIDRRTATVYLLDTPAINLSNRVFGETVASGANAVFVPLPELPELLPGRTVILDDKHTKPHLATLTKTKKSGEDGVELTFTPPLTRELDGATAFALLNVTTATHGETVAGEVLGDGDPAQPFQAFAVAKSPVTHLFAAGADRGVASTLVLRVDGVQWAEVPGFVGRGPRDQVFVADRDEKGQTTVRGGDGRTAAAFPRGAGNVTATHRFGLGAAGNVPAGSLRTPLVRPAGVRGVSNPLAAVGGADAEAPERVRENAPNSVRTFGRVVSLRDFADAAREFPGVLKATATWDRDSLTATAPGEDSRGVRLVVVGADPTPLAAPVLAALRADLDARRDPFLRLTIAPHTPVPLLLSVAVFTRPAYDAATVQAAVRAALLNRFDHRAAALGKAVHLSDLFTAAQAVSGVQGVDVNEFCYKASATVTAHGYAGLVVQPHARMFADELPRLAGDDLEVVGGTP